MENKLIFVAVVAALWSSLPALAADAAPAVEHARIVQDSRGEDVLRLQVLLDRANFGPGEIDGVFGSNVAKAVAGFQRSRGLADTGAPDEATWVELERDAPPTLVEYTITQADADGPYIEIPTDLIEKAALPALGYRSAAEALGERFHASPELLLSLNPGLKLDEVGGVIQVPNVDGTPALAQAAKLVVEQSSLTVTLLDANDEVIGQFPATTGSSHDPLPIGTWKVNGVARNPVFNYNPDLFWNANPEHGKAVLKAGPNNPVGVVWIDLSKEHYGIHGTPEPSKIGKTESHGCIRMTNWNAAMIAEAVKPGVQVILQD
ncbi:MAG TPA: L,D-transpeptidase [Xanthomonadales bacterium]|nr:L,D-transpeptidase [Xanthomonadales bacterium]